MIIFKFKTKNEYNKAVKVLKEAIDKIVSEHFDHSEQDSEMTISVMDEKNAKIVAGLFEKNKIEFDKEEDLSWAPITTRARKVALNLSCSNSL
jgi:redox-regulated HSP33 family molecular chaperone